MTRIVCTKQRPSPGSPWLPLAPPGACYLRQSDAANTWFSQRSSRAQELESWGSTRCTHASASQFIFPMAINTTKSAHLVYLVDILVIFLQVQVDPIVQSCCMFPTGASPHTNGHHFYLHLQQSLRLML